MFCLSPALVRSAWTSCKHSYVSRTDRWCTKFRLCCHYSHHQVTSSLIYVFWVSAHCAPWPTFCSLLCIFVSVFTVRTTAFCAWVCVCTVSANRMIHVASSKCTHRRLFSHRCNPWWSANPIDHNAMNDGRASERACIELMSWLKANGRTFVEKRKLCGIAVDWNFAKTFFSTCCGGGGGVCVGSFFGHFDATISTSTILQRNIINYFRSARSSLAFRRPPRHGHSFVLIFYCFASHCVRISDQTGNDDKVQLLVLIKCRYLYWSCLMRLVCRCGECAHAHMYAECCVLWTWTCYLIPVVKEFPQNSGNANVPTHASTSPVTRTAKAHNSSNDFFQFVAWLFHSVERVKRRKRRKKLP